MALFYMTFIFILLCICYSECKELSGQSDSVVDESEMESSYSAINVTVRKKHIKPVIDSEVKCIPETEDSDSDIIPSSQLKTSRWHREKMKKVGIAKSKGISMAIIYVIHVLYV